MRFFSEWKKKRQFERTLLHMIEAKRRAVPFRDATSIAAGDFHSLVLRSDGTVWSWGKNTNGQLGRPTGADTFSSVASRVPELPKVRAVAAGYDHSLALGEDGTVWSWGANDGGKLGRAGDSRVPILVANLKNVVAIAAGSSCSCASGKPA